MPDENDNAAGSQPPTFMKRMGFAAAGIAIFLTWQHYNSPSSAVAGWNSDWNKAVAQSRATGKPALVLFTADWCPSCRQFESEVLSRADVKNYLAANCTQVIVDLTDREGENNRRAMEYNVRSIPTVVLFDGSGREVARSNGTPAGPFKSWIESGGQSMRYTN
jgi:thiol:disulfide interchange protein